MYARLLQPPERSFFLFGPRGTGKTAWLKTRLGGGALVFDLLKSGTYQRLSASPERIGDLVPEDHDDWVVVDEVQRVPELLNEVHRLIESRKLRFALTGSSARKLRRGGTNLLGGRARTLRMHPLTALELGDDFDLARALRFGTLPFACTTKDPESYLRDYVDTYLREEVQQEGFVRAIGPFSRFLEAASFSQGSVLNMASVARDAGVQAKVVEGHFKLLEGLLLAVRLPVFTRRAKRRMVAHPKFYYFDAGVYRTLRPRGPLDSAEEIDGPALETLMLSNLRAVNDAFALGYELSYWRTHDGREVDFVLYGERGLIAIETKRTHRVRDEDLAPLLTFREEFPMAKAYFVHLGKERGHDRGIDILPAGAALAELDSILGAKRSGGRTRRANGGKRPDA
ncbi:MAG: ATP-binding protein [Planctomycetes bacterium]|nr:ATP-binding protein [Planctomycetota bacterium]